MTRHPLAVAFFTNEEGARFQPDMMGILAYVGGLALEEALDVVGIDGPASATSSCASATPGRCRARAPPPPRSSSCTSSRGRCSRPRASRSAPSRACRASRGRSSRSRASPTTPARRRCDASRRRLRRRRDRRVRAAARREIGGAQVGDGRSARAPPRPRERGRRPAPCSPSTSATPTTRADATPRRAWPSFVRAARGAKA